MKKPSVGIGDLAVYVPNPRISSTNLVAHRAATDDDLHTKLERAVAYTGQEFVRFPEPWEDTVTMGAQAAATLLEQEAGRHVAPDLRYLATGTETSVDHSKPVAAYVQGALQRANYAVPETLSTFQVQHACAGGTLSLISIAALLAHTSSRHEWGMVICSDIAKYRAGSTGEITQGAGAVALSVSREPALLEIDLSAVGVASRDVDDFFRPLGSDTAMVKGRYSLRCYREALEQAVADCATRLSLSTADLLQQTDLFVLHVPYYSLPLDGLAALVRKHLDLDQDGAQAFLRARGFQAALEPTRKLGNLYTGSMFMSLAFLLQERLQHFGDALVGKRVLLASYGSGNTMLVVPASVAPQAPFVIRSWDLNALLAHMRDAGMEEYDAWMEAGYHNPAYPEYIRQGRERIPNGAFFLDAIREDGYREYQYRS